MKIFVKAKTGAKENKVTPPALRLITDETTEEWYLVSVKERPVAGRANDAIIKILAHFFKISQSQVLLLRGATEKRKVFEIMK